MALAGWSDGRLRPSPVLSSAKAAYSAPGMGAHSGRLYVGNEFCERLLPGTRTLGVVCREAATSWGGLTLVTPPVGDAGLDRVALLLRSLARLSPGAEVVANDWGILTLVAEMGSDLRPVLGRLMNKMLRDPRVTPSLAQQSPTAEALRATRQAALTAPAYVRMLARLGVQRVEFDNLHQGIDIDFAALGIQPTLHLPFSCVTTGSACLTSGIGQVPEHKFTSDNPCHRECRVYSATMRDHASAAAAPLISRGNSVFFRQERALVERGLTWAAAHHARMVVRAEAFAATAYATEDPATAKSWYEALHGQEPIAETAGAAPRHGDIS